MLDTKLSNDVINIEDLIYEVRGVQVMLTSDVAKLYNVDTKVLNQTIKRNINRFPESFCFQLSNEEIDILCLRSQFVTLNKKNNMRGQHYKYYPYALTEQGIMMLSGLLKSDIAAQINVKIIHAFVTMRKYISSNLVELKNMNDMLIRHDNRISMLETTFNKLNEKQKVNTIFYKGEIFDAYYLLMDILSEVKKEIIIIDDYVWIVLFKIIKDIKVSVKIITNNKNEIDKKKYESQYNNIEIIKTDYFHDRFIIIDNKKLYHSGSSFKDLGIKCFGISEIEDENILKNILDIIKNSYIE